MTAVPTPAASRNACRRVGDILPGVFRLCIDAITANAHNAPSSIGVSVSEQTVDQGPDSLDRDTYLGPILDRSDAKRRAARDDIAGFEGHVVRDQADLFGGREDHVVERIVLPFDAVERGDHARRTPVESGRGRDRGSEATECIESLRAAPLRKVRIFL